MDSKHIIIVLTIVLLVCCMLALSTNAEEYFKTCSECSTPNSKCTPQEKAKACSGK